MDATITFRPETVKELTSRLRIAWRAGRQWLIKQLSALLMLADRQEVYTIAGRLGVSTTTIYAWRDSFLSKRWASLVRGRSPGRPPKLSDSQRARLKELVLSGPEACGYETGCWNSALIQDLVKREFGKSYNVHYLSTLLKNLGFSYQKARFVADHLDELSRKRWRTRQWPSILRSAKRHNALLLFADEASFAQWGSLGYTWAPRGEQPTVKTTGKRKGYKVMGMVDYFSGRLFVEGSTERFTAKRYCAFLTRILAETEQPLVVIQDGASYHTAAETKRFVAQHAARLSVHQLPSYSPDYNPIEHLWRNVKREKTHNRYFPSFEALVQAVDTGLASFQADPAAVRQLMGPYLEATANCARKAA
ncbi:MAG: IS630 family transposase [Chloroflexales bacterium]|nr:IS630 family transposase [Chloroflexales bacterium]